MEDIIKKAIEGGYGCPEKHCSRWINTDGIENPSMHYDHLWELQSDMLLDPLFWKALSKACGWNGDFYRASIDGSSEWYLRAMSFHEINLTEGWDSAISYLTNLIKS